MLLKAVAGEVIYDKGNEEDQAGETGDFYPAGHLWSVALIHGAAFVATAKFIACPKSRFAKVVKCFAKPGIVYRTGSMGI